MCRPVRDNRRGKKTEKKVEEADGSIEEGHAATDTWRKTNPSSHAPASPSLTPPPSDNKALWETKQELCGAGADRVGSPEIPVKAARSYIGSPLERRSTTRPLCSSDCEPRRSRSSQQRHPAITRPRCSKRGRLPRPAVAIIQFIKRLKKRR